MESLQESRHAVANGLQREVYLAGNLTVGVAAGEQIEHLAVGGIHPGERRKTHLLQTPFGVSHGDGVDGVHVRGNVEHRLVEVFHWSLLAHHCAGTELVTVDECGVVLVVHQRDQLAVTVRSLRTSRNFQAFARWMCNVDHHNFRLVLLHCLHECMSVVLGNEHGDVFHWRHRFYECLPNHFLLFANCYRNHMNHFSLCCFSGSSVVPSELAQR